MKKLFAVLAVFALVFAVVLAACPTEDDTTDNGKGEIGKKGPGGGTIFFAEGNQYMECSGELGNNNWEAAITTAANYRGGGFSDWHLSTRNELDLMYKNLKKNGLGGFSNSRYWTSAEDDGWAYYQDFDGGSQSSYYKSNSYGVRAVRAYSKSANSGNARLKINNQSFTEITDVIWNNVTFANNQYENSIKTGTNVTNNVEAGGGYIFFRRKTNPIIARTRDLVVVENNQQIEFTFTDNTVIVEVNNPNNSGTLGTVNSTVLWFDDAEGEMQPYYESRSFVGYYRVYSDLGPYLVNENQYRFHSPIRGQRAIAIGGTNTARLHLKITLDKNAKLSFWYANRRPTGSGNTIFSINGVTNRTWATEVNWASMTIDLEAGVNDIIWEKTDGYTSYDYYYLSLDDILIYYTE